MFFLPGGDAERRYAEIVLHHSFRIIVCERINEFYPAKFGKEEWQWRIPFKTTTMEFSEDLLKDEIFEKLDLCLQEILEFESNLQKELNS